MLFLLEMESLDGLDLGMVYLDFQIQKHGIAIWYSILKYGSHVLEFIDLSFETISAIQFSVSMPCP